MPLQQSLEFKLSQHLALTPQLQQAIQLLQLSTLELQDKIQDIVASNPMLEMEENPSLGTSPNMMLQSLLPKLSCDISHSSKQHRNDLVLEHNLENNPAAADTLQDYLHWQRTLTPFTNRDDAIATLIIDAIDDDGFLRQSLETLAQSIGPLGEEIPSLAEIAVVLQRVQQFDPSGIAATNLQECLLIQLKQQASHTPHLDDAILIIENHIDALASHDYERIKKRCHLEDRAFNTALDLIHSLNPRPGRQIISEETDYIIPDLLIKKESGIWQVSLNDSLLPRLKINHDYAKLIQRADNSPDNVFLKDHLQEARWFIKSLQSRYDTLFKVASKIIEHQIDFLEHGAAAMKPLVLHDIAKALDLHESTISRVTTGKYIYTPQGLFELKYFFSSHVQTASGGACSSTAIRAFIKKLVGSENPKKPLSDNQIAHLLQAEGIDVARRTITKYRESLHIPPSHERKLPSFAQRH